MTGSGRGDAERLLGAAREVYADQPEALAAIDGLERRLRDPLRLALAGMVKAGKSTLLNALLGEQIAPTDAGECTRVVTWYRYSDTPTVTLHPRHGEPRRMAVRRDGGRLVLGLGGLPAEEVDWIDIGWPSSGLKKMILIDTPGIGSLTADASARAALFLTPEDTPTAADAVLYLMRHMHTSDLKFLEAFRDHAAGIVQSTSALGILSRSDEIGSGRIDSLLSAAKVARRYERHPDLATLVLGVLPVAGLVAESARTLREREFVLFQQLAGLDRDEREQLLMSVDRFTTLPAPEGLEVEARREILDRFGMYGIRLATALIRGGAASSSELAAQLVEHSGVIELQQFVRHQFRTRADALKIRRVLAGLEGLLRDHPVDGSERLRAGVEKLEADTHQLRELALLATARSQGLPLPDAEAEEARRILGGDGTPSSDRLGLDEHAPVRERRVRLVELQERWRRLSGSPLTDRAAAGVCRVVLRSLDEIASELRAGDHDLLAADVVAAGGPGHGAGHDAPEQGEDGEPALGVEDPAQRLAALADRDELP